MAHALRPLATRRYLGTNVWSTWPATRRRLPGRRPTSGRTERRGSAPPVPPIDELCTRGGHVSRQPWVGGRAAVPPVDELCARGGHVSRQPWVGGRAAVRPVDELCARAGHVSRQPRRPGGTGLAPAGDLSCSRGQARPLPDRAVTSWSHAPVQPGGRVYRPTLGWQRGRGGPRCRRPHRGSDGALRQLDATSRNDVSPPAC